jgi:asparagine synthase (glutamine-hydrolysing)
MELVARSGDVTLPLDPIRRAQWVEFNTLLAGYLLSSQGDRMAFSQGVENRCPFLALAVVELAASLPVDLSLRDGRGEKHILREAFREFVPAAAVGRRKRPYTSPDAAVLLHPRSVLHDIVTEARLREIEGLDVGFALRLVAKLRSAPHAATPGETQALAVLTSIALLHSWFVAAQPPPLGRVTAPTVVDVVRSPS